MKSFEKKYAVLLFTLCSIVFFLSHEDSSSLAAVDTQIAVPEKITLTVVTHPQPQGRYDYIEIIDSCTSDFEGNCLYAYSGPGVKYEKLYELRNGMLFKIKTKEERNGQVWYRVHFDEQLRYPDRVEGDWYIPAVVGRIITDNGEQLLTSLTPETSKRIIIDLSDHMIYAYDGNMLFLTTKVSTGVSSAPTPIGIFTIYKKTPSRYMQGPIPGVTEVPFDLPGVSWNMYFTQDGAVIHGAYWHDRYGTNQSSGCINLPPELAKILYDWVDVGTQVVVEK